MLYTVTYNIFYLDQGLSKHQEVGSTPVTKDGQQYQVLVTIFLILTKNVKLVVYF